MSFKIHTGDVLEVLGKMPSESVMCVVTSPPYWGLRDYNVDGMIGFEPTFELHLEKLVEVFREVRRVLRADGTLWLNYGDAYAGSGKGGHTGRSSLNGARRNQRECKDAALAHAAIKKKANVREKLAAKQRILMPPRVAIALQDDGWWVRSSIVWAKGISLCPAYSGSCMPSSVLDRPTDSHEMLYLLSKSSRYFYDSDAVREGGTGQAPGNKESVPGVSGRTDGYRRRPAVGWEPKDGMRNLRTVWAINPKGSKESHFATFPEGLVRPCVLAGTSAHGACSVCRAPWQRIVSVDYSGCNTLEVERVRRGPVDAKAIGAYLKAARKAKGLSMREVDAALGTTTMYSWYEGRREGIHTPRPDRWRELKAILDLDERFDASVTATVTTTEMVSVQPAHFESDNRVRRNSPATPTRRTVGWEPSCKHTGAPIRPCVVLDPFSGTGTTGAVAVRFGRDYVGIELSQKYVRMSRKKIGRAAADVGLGGTLTVDEDPRASQLGLFA